MRHCRSRAPGRDIKARRPAPITLGSCRHDQHRPRSPAAQAACPPPAARMAGAPSASPDAPGRCAGRLQGARRRASARAVVRTRVRWPVDLRRAGRDRGLQPGRSAAVRRLRRRAVRQAAARQRGAGRRLRRRRAAAAASAQRRCPGAPQRRVAGAGRDPHQHAAGRRRQAEPGAAARHVRPPADPGSAHATGQLRQPHRVAQPRLVPPAPGRRDGARTPRRRTHGADVPRSRPLQGRERQPRSRGRRPLARARGRDADRQPARRRLRGPVGGAGLHGLAAGRRRVHRDRRGDRRHRRCGPDRATPARRARRAVRPRRGGARRLGQHRHQHLPDRRRRPRRPAAPHRHGDVPRQVAGPRHVLLLQRRPRRRRLGTGVVARQSAPGGRAQRVRAALPAQGRSAQRRDHGRRGAAALARPRPRHGGAGPLHRRARGDRPHRAGRRLGAAQRDRAARAVGSRGPAPPVHGGQRVGAPVPARAAVGLGARHAARARHRAGAPGDRAHRVAADGGQRGHARHARQLQAARLAPVARRLRYRPLVARLPAPLQPAHAQDRPQLRRCLAQQSRGHGDRAHHRGARPQHEHDGGRRGRGDRGAGTRAHRARLRADAGLSAEPPA